jgi:hypothetical protein
VKSCLRCYSYLILTNYLTLQNIVFLEKLIVTHLVKKFPKFYGTWRFITVFRCSHHLALASTRWIQCHTLLPYLFKTQFNVTLNLCVSLPWGLIFTVFWLKFCVYFPSFPCMDMSLHSLLYLMILIILVFAEEYKLWSSSMQFSVKS